MVMLVKIATRRKIKMIANAMKTLLLQMADNPKKEDLLRIMIIAVSLKRMKIHRKVQEVVANLTIKCLAKKQAHKRVTMKVQKAKMIPLA